MLGLENKAIMPCDVMLTAHSSDLITINSLTRDVSH